uniref:Uncharacterized protein n=1 Tax=Microcoleus asticus IPMA8 TaxID=2563858 RepID=A0ABX2D8Y0_9CYAN|nr:hypothetical protein [Microcoleus asticus IPMA8]
MIEYVAHVSVSKKLYDVILPRTVTILEMSTPSGLRDNSEVLKSSIEL